MFMLSGHRRRSCCPSLPHGYWGGGPSFLPHQNGSFESVSSYQRGGRGGGTTSFPDLVVVVLFETFFEVEVEVVCLALTRGQHGDEDCVLEVPENLGFA